MIPLYQVEVSAEKESYGSSITLKPILTHHTELSSSFFTMPTDSPAIKILSVWFGILVFFFSPDVIHAEFLDRLVLTQHQDYYSVVCPDTRRARTHLVDFEMIKIGVWEKRLGKNTMKILRWAAEAAIERISLPTGPEEGWFKSLAVSIPITATWWL